MRLQPLRGRAILHFAWARVCGWLVDLAIDPTGSRVAALQLRRAEDVQVIWLAPFPVWWSPRHSWLLECDPDTWRPIDPQPEWITFDAFADLVVIKDNRQMLPVVDAECDSFTWAITAYLRPSPWWWPPSYVRLSPEHVTVTAVAQPVLSEVGDQRGLAHGGV